MRNLLIIALAVFAGTVLYSDTSSDVSPDNFLVGFQDSTDGGDDEGSPELANSMCRTAPPSFCANVYNCYTSDMSNFAWHCQDCSGATSNFNTCRYYPNSTCSNDELLNPCGDALEDFVRKRPGVACEDACTPTSVIGPCSNLVNYGC